MLFTLFQMGLPLIYTLGILVAYVVIIGFSMGFHEFAHAYVAYKNGDITAKMAGRLTLNPFKHFNAYGFVCLIVLGFGWADPVPVNPYYLNRGRRSMFAVAIAGITANLVLALFFSCIYSLLGVFAYDFLMGESFYSFFVYYLLMFGIEINLSLAVFNLLPFFPLDGSKVLSLMLKPDNKLLQFLERYSLLIMLALLFFGVISYIVGVATEFLGTGMIVMWSWLFGLGA